MRELRLNFTAHVQVLVDVISYIIIITVFQLLIMVCVRIDLPLNEGQTNRNEVICETLLLHCQTVLQDRCGKRKNKKSDV